MIVKIKGIGSVKFPDGMSRKDITKVLSDNFAAKPDKKPIDDIKTIRAIVKEVISDTIKPVKPIVPDVKVTMEPVIEVTMPTLDMEPLAKILKQIADNPKPNIDVHIDNDRATQVEIEVTDRDARGNIKKLMWTEIATT